MFEPTAEQIAAEMRAFPGLGQLQARGRIQQRRYLNAQRNRRPVATNWIK